LNADDFGGEHQDRWTQHPGLGLDPANAPAQTGRAVDHGGVGIGAHQRIGIGDLSAGLILVGPNGLGQIFQVHLVADAGARRHHAEVFKRGLAPFEELVALDIALVFRSDERRVGTEGRYRRLDACG